MTKHSQTVEQLEQKNAGALRELDRVTMQLHKAQDLLKEQQEVLEEKKFTQQLAGWAIDRALEAAKLAGSDIKTTDDVISTADKMAKWVTESSAPISTKKETVQ